MNTKFKTAADFRKSLENRLKTISLKMDYDLQRLRRTVAFDRLLARIVAHNDSSFVLKGGYAMELRLSNARATKDIDLTCLQRLKEGQYAIGDMILDELRTLVERNLDDFFTYQISDAQVDLDNAPYGGARYSVSSFVDGKLFVRFQLDVGCDAIISTVETLPGKDWLGFCGIPAPNFNMISIEQQFVEKLHAYTLPRSNIKNTRVKDLIDMVLLGRMRQLDFQLLKNVLNQVFALRKTHLIPIKLDLPPTEWERPYLELGKECNLSISMHEAFLEVADIYEKMNSAAHSEPTIFPTN